MKLVVGVISTDCNDYEIKAQSVWKKYMHMNPNVIAYFLKFDNTKPNNSFIEDTFYCHANDQKETIETMVHKSLEFMKIMLEDDSWDYILRTNLSSVFNWDRVLSFLSKYNNFDVIANKVTPPFPNAWPVSAIPTGCGMFLSRKAVNGIVTEWLKDPNLSNFIYPDDVMIGILLGRSGFNVLANYNYEMILPYMGVNHRYFHLRCKMFNEPIHRVQHEIPMMEKWIEAWYG